MKTQILSAVLMCSGLYAQVGTAEQPGIAEFMGVGRLMGGTMGGAVSAPPADANGWGFYSVSAFSGFINGPGFLQTTLTGDFQIQNRVDNISGVTASMGYAKTLGERTRFFVIYAPSGSIYPASLSRSRMGHILNANLSTSLSGRWTLRLGVNGSYADFEQYAFQPARIAEMSQVPSSLDEFLNGVNSGQYANNQIAALLTGAPILEAPARTSIYGNLSLNASTSIGLSYKASPRLSLSFNGTAYRFQTVSQTGEAFQAPLAPTSTGVNGGVTLSYSLSERSSVNAGFQVQRTLSRLSDANYYTATGGYSRRLGQRWGVNANGGTGFSDQNRLAVAGVAGQKNYIASAGLTYQATPHQVYSANYGRTFVDMYGLGLVSSQSGSANWAYSSPGRGWSVNVNTSYYKSDQNALRSVEGMFATASYSRLIGHNQGLSVAAFYSKNTNNLTDLAIVPSGVKYDQEGVRVMYTWYPRTMRGAAQRQ